MVLSNYSTGSGAPYQISYTMSDIQTNNKRIAKNTFVLYVRMLFTMVVSLFTSRVLLNALGIEDYGIYNVVGGFVIMFNALSGSFSTAITRFITYELGKGNLERLKAVFSTSINIQLLMSIGITILVEVVGMWFIKCQMNIPVERIDAAYWVLHCAIVAFILNLISVPYNAEIIAHEEMSVYAAISILDVTLKLVIAYLLLLSSYDRLISYSVLFVIEALIIRVIYGIYCKRKFVECNYKFTLDRLLFSEMGKFAGWNFLGTSAGMLNTQGVNMLMNIYFGVAVNAARGIAVQVEHAVSSFAGSFTTAINPQITKSYSVGNLQNVFQLVCRGAKFNAFLFLYLSVPVVIEAPIILEIWLKTVPSYCVEFVRLIIFASFIDGVIGKTFWIAIMATGRIKWYQIMVALVGVMVFPISWGCFALGLGPESTYVVYICIYVFVLFVRIYYMKILVEMPYSYFLKEALPHIILVMGLSFLLPYLFTVMMDEGIFRLCFTCVTSTLSTSIIIYYLGLTYGERAMVISTIKKRLSRKR